MKIFSTPPLSRRAASGFGFTDLLMILAALILLGVVLLPMLANSRAYSRRDQCVSNLRDIGRAMLAGAESNGERLPDSEPTDKKAIWWFYKEQIKGDLGLRGPSSPSDKVFACPDDRGYEEDTRPFRLSAKFDYSSYVFNGVNLPGLPNIAGRRLSTIKEPSRTLLVMEWTAHAPLSWHRSRTGKHNQPFYNDAESVVSFVDGHVDFIPIYYDGMNAAYTRDPIPGYRYKYSGD